MAWLNSHATVLFGRLFRSFGAERRSAPPARLAMPAGQSGGHRRPSGLRPDTVRQWAALRLPKGLANTGRGLQDRPDSRAFSDAKLGENSQQPSAAGSG